MTGKNFYQPKPQKQPARALKYTPKPVKAKPSLPNPTIPTQSRITEASQATDAEKLTDVTESPPVDLDENPFQHFDASKVSGKSVKAKPTKSSQTHEPSRPQMTFGFPPGYQPKMNVLSDPTEFTGYLELAAGWTARKYQYADWCGTSRLKQQVSHNQFPEPDVYNPGPTQSPFDCTPIAELGSETIAFCNEYVQAIEDRDETIGDLKLELAEMNLKMAEQEHEADGRLQVVERQLLSMNQLAVRLAEENDLLHALVHGRTLLRSDPACPIHGYLHQ